MSARSEILARIAAAHAWAPPAADAYADVARDYRRADPEPATDDVVHLLAERITDYRATVHRCAEDEVAAIIRTVLDGHGVSSVVVPGGLPDAWRPAGLEVLVDDGDHPRTVAELDRVGGVVTAAAVGIAETGTVVLDGGADQGRRVITLVPDHHVCVLWRDQVVAGVPEALLRLDPGRPLTMISGPSATSDIELDRVEGVHGPRVLDVVIIDA